LIWDATDFDVSPVARPDNINNDQMESLWEGLADREAARAYQAVWKMVGAPSLSVTFLRNKLQAAKPIPAKHIAGLVADLGADRFAVREKAYRELDILGELAVPALQKALTEEPKLEMRRRVERLLSARQVALPSPHELRLVRALAALEHINTPESRAVLKQLADRAVDARLTQEARASLQRLVKRPAIP
jgi:hypothetical protein